LRGSREQSPNDRIRRPGTPTEWGIFSDAAATSSNMQNTDTASIPLIADNGKCQMDSDVTKYFQDFSHVPSTDFWAIN